MARALHDPAQEMEFQQKYYTEGLMSVAAYEISHYGAQNCLDNQYNNLSSGNHVESHPCNATGAQGWWLNNEGP